MLIDTYKHHVVNAEAGRYTSRRKELAKALGVDHATLNYWLRKKRPV